MKSKDLTPLIMWFILFSGAIVLAFIRLYRIFGVWQEYPVYLDIIFICLYLLGEDKGHILNNKYS
jgi:hypothetical protein